MPPTKRPAKPAAARRAKKQQPSNAALTKKLTDQAAQLFTQGQELRKALAALRVLKALEAYPDADPPSTAAASSGAAGKPSSAAQPSGAAGDPPPAAAARSDRAPATAPAGDTSPAAQHRAPISKISQATQGRTPASPPATPESCMAAQPRYDDLRVRFSSFAESDQAALRNRLLIQVWTLSNEMPTGALQNLAQAADLLDSNRGCSTPAEELISHLLAEHYQYGGITPASLENQLDIENTDGFRLNFEDVVKTTEHFQGLYSPLKLAPTAPVSQPR